MGTPSKTNPQAMFTVERSGLESMLRVAAEHYAEGAFARAIEVLRGLVHLNPDDARPLKLLGATYFQLQDHAMAMAVYDKALALDADDPYTLVALAELSFLALSVSRGLECLRTLSRLDPEGKHPASSRGRYLLEHHLKKMTGGDS